MLWLQVNQLIKVQFLLGGKNLDSEDQGTRFSYTPSHPSPPRDSSLIRPACQSWPASGKALSLSELLIHKVAESMFLGHFVKIRIYLGSLA